MKPKTWIIGLLATLLLPFLLGLAWTFGLVRFGDEPVMTNRTPAFEQATTLARADLIFCLSKDYSGRLSLHRASSPASPAQTTRLRNRLARVVVDVFSNGDGAIVRVYTADDKPLARTRQLAIQSCIPENGFPSAVDPRNRDFYSGRE